MRPVLLQIPLHTDPEDCSRLCRPCIVCTYLYNLHKGGLPLGVVRPTDRVLGKAVHHRHEDPGDEIWLPNLRNRANMEKHNSFNVRGYTKFWSPNLFLLCGID